jgi:site-specific recombinase XerD
MKDVFSLKEAEELTGKPASSLRRMLNAGEIGGHQIKKKSRDVWVIPQATIDLLNSKGDAGNYDFLYKKWIADQISGFHTGKPLSERTIQANEGGMAYFWRYLGEPPSVKAITAANLKRAISNVPVDLELRKCHYVQKEHMYKSVTSFCKLLIREGLRSNADLYEMREVPFRRVYSPKRDSLTESQLFRLIKENYAWTTGGRTEFDAQLTHILIMLPAFAGLRRAEVINLEIEHVDFHEGVIKVIDGKGHKDRTVGIVPALRESLLNWIGHHRPTSSSKQFVVQENGAPINASVYSHRIKSLSEKTNISINPHGLRRTFATVLDLQGMSVNLIRIALGHADVRTTQEYLMSNERDMINWLQGSGSNVASTPTAKNSKNRMVSKSPKKYILRRLLDV